MRRRPGIYRSLSYALVLVLILGGGILYMTHMPGKSWSGVLPPLTAEQARLADRLGKHITMLSEEIGERNLWRDGTLDAAADYIEETLQSMGYAVSSQVYTVQGTSVRNLEAVHGGTSLAEEIVLIGAHYDTVSGSPGANDNASGVAALIEIARLLAAKQLARSCALCGLCQRRGALLLHVEDG